ncbi:MAG: hypothetical protein WBV55_01180 [Candidatus Sulfotelmatobacter sp.]
MMKKHIGVILVSLCMAMPSLLSQTRTNGDKSAVPTTQLPIPEEARKHFVMGTTLLKDAKTSDDYAQVESHFKQAISLAPQWPEARYNLALTREAAGDYSGAMADLKIYQLFKLSDADARNTQDKIYVLEAKQQKSVSDAATKVASDAANAQAAADFRKDTFIRSIQGDWGNGNKQLSISPFGNGNVDVTFHMSSRNLAVSDMKTTESTLQFTVDMVENGNPETLDHYSLSIDGNGPLTGSYVDALTEGGKAMIRRAGYTPAGDQTFNCMFFRQ